jgi:hypothetical protein
LRVCQAMCTLVEAGWEEETSAQPCGWSVDGERWHTSRKVHETGEPREWDHFLLAMMPTCCGFLSLITCRSMCLVKWRLNGESKLLTLTEVRSL